MKLRLIVFHTIVLLISATQLYGQFKPEFNVSTGVAVPDAPQSFNSFWNNGYNLGAGIDIPISNSFSIGSYLGYNNLRSNLDEMTKLSGYQQGNTYYLSGGNATIINILLNLKAYIRNESRITPYFCGGAGLFFVNAGAIYKRRNGSLIDIVDSEKERTSGLNGGIGLEFFSNKKIGFFIEGRYYLVQTKNIPYGHGDANSELFSVEGANTQYFNLKVGFKIK